MITMIYAWHYGVMGMEITLFCCGICMLSYFVFCFLFCANRRGKGKVILGWLICEIICDLLWYLYYFPNGDYVNRGIGGAAACFILPLFLIGAAMAVTAWNVGIEERADAD